jgi:hypothetical protein
VARITSLWVRSFAVSAVGAIPGLPPNAPRRKTISQQTAGLRDERTQQAQSSVGDRKAKIQD